MITRLNDEEKQENFELAEQLISEQNFSAAVIAGAVATLLAAAAYGITVATWIFSSGFAAVGVGIIVGLSMGFLGRGISAKFAVVATVYTIAGCVIGNLFRAIVELTPANATSPIDALRNNSLSVLIERAISNMSLVDAVFWFVAVFCAVYLAKRPLSRSERLAIGMFELRR